MPRPIHIAQVDVFTRTPLTGNAAAVVLDADDLPEPTMQAIAREMNLSETAFVFAPTPAGEIPVRFFTPACEVPVCGHATLGAHYVRARALGLASGEVAQRSAGGRWVVRWEPRDGGTFLTMEQGPVEFGDVWHGEPRAELLQALDATETDLLPGWPVQTVSTGHPKVVVPLADPARLAALRPVLPALESLSVSSGVNGYFVFAPTGPGSTAARMFGPAMGVAEDPVNGSGHGPLGAYLSRRSGPLAAAAGAGFWSRMGDHLGRPGRVWVRVRPGGEAVDVGGFVVPVFEAVLAPVPAGQ